MNFEQNFVSYFYQHRHFCLIYFQIAHSPILYLEISITISVSFTHSLTHSLSRCLTHSFTHSLIHSLTHSLTLIYLIKLFNLHFSDWFVFAFPSVIPYKKFVIRIDEEDFLKNPNGILDHIKQSFSKNKIENMKHEMKYWLKYVTYQPQIAYINNTTMSVTNSGNTDHDNQRFGLSEEEMIKNSVIHDRRRVKRTVGTEI